MDPFVVIILGGVAGLVVALLLLGWLYPGSGADQVGWRPTRSVAVEVQNELDDLEQMLEAANARRRRRGEPELTEASVRDTVAADLRETVRRQEDHRLAELDAAQMLAAKNARRRAKGLPELTPAAYRSQLERDSG
ncbi:MAG: hypothetical protein QOH43_3184 [Solirubrobacteraceae bacterium]|jgi:hypothetical protein|nr:hypothetical protein [Solirubrobacteraceae bacterium]